MDIVLIGGLWTRDSVWDAVVAELGALGHRGLPVALPATPDATLADQLSAVLAAVDGADRPLVVGHSAAGTLAWLAADARPDRVAAVALVGGFPSPGGTSYADFFPVVDGVMPFPGWEVFEGPDSVDLDDNARQAFSAASVPVPAGVSKATVTYADPRRLDVPVVLVCPEYSPEDARKWLADGQMPEIAAATDVSYVDIDSGHWPMITRPAELAAILADLTGDGRL